MSESWERPEKPLDQIINLPNHTVISNPHQRKGVGGRPALIVNHSKYHVRNLTQSLIEIPWGVEATWALISPKNVTSDSKIKRIAMCSVYSKPDSRKKSLLLDHVNVAYNIISSKYGKGLHFIIAGDTNDLKLDNILNISPNLKQLVSGATRLSPPAMLDPIISTLGRYYQLPVCLPPLDPDPESNGSPSDHLIVLMKPLNSINNKPARVFKEVTVRPLTTSGLEKFKVWIQSQDWADIINLKSVDDKADALHSMVLSRLDEFCPEKKRKLSSDDCPWFTEQLKKLDRKKRREYNQNRRSQKYLRLKRIFDRKVLKEKKLFKSRMIDEVMIAHDSQWYSALKRISNYGQEKGEPLQVEEIIHLTDKQQAEAIADSLSAISNEYQPVNKDEIKIPPFHHSDIPQIPSKKIPAKNKNE